MTAQPSATAPTHHHADDAGTESDAEDAPRRPEAKENSWANLLINIAIPAIIMMQLSAEDRLGPVWSLVAALLFPLSYGIWFLIRQRSFHAMSIAGLVGVLLTGGFALLELPRIWIIVKETAIPAIFGIVVLGLHLMGRPVVMWAVRKFLDWDAVLDSLETDQERQALQRRISWVNWAFAGGLFFSAVMNFILASYLLQSEPGTPEFVDELGQMTALSFPVIAVPQTILNVGLLFYLFWALKKLTGRDPTQFIRGMEAEAQTSDQRG